MPNRSKRPCSYPGCSALAEAGRCDKHKQQERTRYEQQRGTATSRGYDSRWRKARLGYLRAHPLCVECERNGRVTAATVVDHIVPHKGDKALFWDSENNWQSMCKPHHDAKTAREDGGFGHD